MGLLNIAPAGGLAGALLALRRAPPGRHGISLPVARLVSALSLVVAIYPIYWDGVGWRTWT